MLGAELGSMMLLFASLGCLYCLPGPQVAWLVTTVFIAVHISTSVKNSFQTPSA
jgi:hypothetical protein